MNISKFKFDRYKILKSQIEIDENYEGDSAGLKIKFKTSGIVKQSENTFVLYLNVKIKNSDTTVNIELDALGEFKYVPVEDIKEMDNYFYVNASAILFPYLRAYISTLSALSSIKTITLPTLNLTNLAAELKENTVYQ